MEATNLDMMDLVAVTVGNIRSGGISDNDIATDVRLDGNNVLVGSKPIPIHKIRACRNSAKGFLNLIKSVL